MGYCKAFVTKCKNVFTLHMALNQLDFDQTYPGMNLDHKRLIRGRTSDSFLQVRGYKCDGDYVTSYKLDVTKKYKHLKYLKSQCGDRKTKQYLILCYKNIFKSNVLKVLFEIWLHYEHF